MTNNHLLLAVVENLKLKENTVFDLSGWVVTNNLQIKHQIIPNMGYFTHFIGDVSWNIIIDNTIAFKVYQAEENEDIRYVLSQEAANLNGILLLIWFIKDNSIFSSTLYSQDIDKYNVFVNRRDTFISNTKGIYESSLLDQTDIEEIQGYNLFQKYKEVVFLLDKTKEEAPCGRFYKQEIEKHFVGHNRLQRSFLLLNIARKTSFLPMKIGFYINTLECLILRDSSELNFRLQLYLANFIGKDKDDKCQIKNTLQNAYKIRSKFFHGDTLNVKQINDLQNISQQLDEVIRRSLKKAISISDTINNNDKLEDYFSSTFFS